MSAAESIVLALIEGGAFFYLARRAWQRFAGRGSGCCGRCPVAPPAATKKLNRGVPVKSPVVFLLAAALSTLGARADLTKRQMAQAEKNPVLSVPSPAEFFGAVDKAIKPDWASFYREPLPTSYPVRTQTAFNLGTLVTDAYLAVEAQDGQQVKNVGKDIITLARALGVGEHVLQRGKSIGDFADRNDWFALSEELEATTNEVRRAMGAQRDEALAALISAGAWLRALHVSAGAAVRSEDPAAAALLRQSSLLGLLRAELRGYPEAVEGSPLVAQVDAALTVAAEKMKPAEDETAAFDQARQIESATGELLAAMVKKES
jgi:hypothetical protein